MCATRNQQLNQPVAITHTKLRRHKCSVECYLQRLCHVPKDTSQSAVTLVREVEYTQIITGANRQMLVLQVMLNGFSHVKQRRVSQASCFGNFLVPSHWGKGCCASIWPSFYHILVLN